VLLFSIGVVPAQRPPIPMMPGFPPQPGRFVVAHATDKRIVVLDTATGRLYKAGEDDLKKMSDLPKLEGGFAPPFPGGGPGRDDDRRPPRPGDRDDDRRPRPPERDRDRPEKD
jgi:hypothetical protein